MALLEGDQIQAWPGGRKGSECVMIWIMSGGTLSVIPMPKPVSTRLKDTLSVPLPAMSWPPLSLPPYLSYRTGRVFQEGRPRGCTAQCGHPHTGTARSHPPGGTPPSPTTGSCASETSRSGSSWPTPHRTPRAPKSQRWACLLTKGVLWGGSVSDTFLLTPPKSE